MTSSLLLKEILRLQITEATPSYPGGLFPSQRRHLYLPVTREDSNIFFSASVLYILENMQDYLPEPDQQLIQIMGARIRQNYPLYRNKNGAPTYNFWQTNPSRHFPNGRTLSQYKHFQLPDEIDTTALIYLTSPPPLENIIWLKQKLDQQALPNKNQVKTTLQKYQHLKAYSTWFGNKMPVEFDVCALSNLLLLLLKYNVPQTEQDNDSLALLRGVIQDKDYFTQPYYISPAYPNAAVIFYHLARLLAQHQIPELTRVKAQLLEDIQWQFRRAINPFEKIILNTSFLKLGAGKSLILPQKDYSGVAASRFYFFTAGFLSVYQQPLLKYLAKYAFSHLKFNCTAFNLTLLLEHEVYIKRLNRF